MFRSRLLGYGLFAVGAIAMLAVTPSFAQDDPNATEVEDVQITGSRVARQDFENLTPVTTLDPDELIHTERLSLGWREDNQQTANRTRTRGSRGASAVRVVRACEVSLTLGDEDCAGK